MLGGDGALVRICPVTKKKTRYHLADCDCGENRSRSAAAGRDAQLRALTEASVQRLYCRFFELTAVFSPRFDGRFSAYGHFFSLWLEALFEKSR